MKKPKYISFKEARRIALEILKEAERKRDEFAEIEAKQGIQYDDGKAE